MAERCKAKRDGNRLCANGFPQSDFCDGKGPAANGTPYQGDRFYKLRKEAYPQCLWDDGVALHTADEASE